MTRILLTFIVLLLFGSSFGQTSICDRDSISVSGQIIQRLKKEGISGISISSKKTNKTYQGYRICEHNYMQIDSLSHLLTDLQIDTLLGCNHGTLKCLGFILFIHRNDEKQVILNKLQEILKQDYVLITSCGDLLNSQSFGHFAYSLITTKTFFYTAHFKLTGKERATIKLELEHYELPVKAK